MPHPSQHASPAELSVLKLLWARPELRIAEIAGELYPGGGASEYSTVQKLLERLEQKGLVARSRTTRAHTFRALVERPDFLRRRLRDLADLLCEGSHVPLLTQLVRSRALSSEERSELRQLLDESESGEEEMR